MNRFESDRYPHKAPNNETGYTPKIVTTQQVEEGILDDGVPPNTIVVELSLGPNGDPVAEVVYVEGAGPLF